MQNIKKDVYINLNLCIILKGNFQLKSTKKKIFIRQYNKKIKKSEHQRTDDFKLRCWRRCLRVPWTSRRSNPSIPKEINPKYSLKGLILLCWDFILWPPDGKNWFTGKKPDAGKDWRQEEKGVTEDEMVGWHHQLDGHEFGQASGVGDGQGGLVCCTPWGRKEWWHDWATELNW